MSSHCFFIPARTPAAAQNELNAWLASLRLLAVHREWPNHGAQLGWALCIEVQRGQGPLPEVVKANSSANRRRGAEVDYRQLMAKDDFALCARRPQRQDQSLRPALSRAGFGRCLQANRKCPGGPVGGGCRRTPSGGSVQG